MRKSRGRRRGFIRRFTCKNDYSAASESVWELQFLLDRLEARLLSQWIKVRVDF